MHGTRDNGGFTLVEVVIVLAILSVMVHLVMQLSLSSAGAQEHANRLGRSNELNQDILDNVRMDLMSSVRVFDSDTVGQEYLALCDTSSTKTPITSVMPTRTLDTSFAPETATGARTGNTLLFALHDRTDEYDCTSGSSYRLDVYRIIRYYLAEEGNGPEPDSPVGLNLCRWVSEPLVDGSQVDRIADATDKTELLEHLRDATPDSFGDVHDPVELVWRVGESPSLTGTLRQIDGSGGLSDTPLAPRPASWVVLPDLDESSDGLLFYRHFSVATNYAHSAMGVARYGARDDTGDGFPHGFEVQCIGPTSGRQVLVHLVIVSTRLQGLPAYSDLTTIAPTRDI